MPRNVPPPACPKCRKPMQFLPRKTLGGRKFQCPNCEGDNALQPLDVAKPLTGEVQPLK